MMSENAFYKGDFRNSLFFGKGLLIHTDSKNQFEGEFLDHYKHGKANFLLEDGHQFNGEFKFGILTNAGKANYGRRF